MGVSQSPGHRICHDCAPYCGVLTVELWWSSSSGLQVQVLNSYRSFHHAAKIWPPKQVGPSCCDALGILTSFSQIWHVVGNTFLTKFHAYLAVRKKMQISPQEERLWRKTLGREMLWESQVQGNISHGLCLLHTKESSLWTKMTAAVCCSWSYLVNFHIFSRKILNTSVLSTTWITFSDSPQEEVFFKDEVICLSGVFWRVF